MIQRIQSLWLLSAAAAAVLMFFYPVIQVVGDNSIQIYDYESISIGGIENFIQSGYLVAVLVGIIAAFSFINIFLFKNRIRQMRICTFISLLVIFLVIMIIVFSFRTETKIAATIGLSSILPVIIFIFILMARRAIRKDEALVRSVDRLR